MSTYNENDTCLKLIFTFFQSSVIAFLCLYEFVNVAEHGKSKATEKNSTFSFTHMPRGGLTKLIPVKPIPTSTPKLIIRICHHHIRSKPMN